MSETKGEKSFEAEVEAEKRKISELFRELKNKDSSSKNDEKLNWMYRNPSENVETEEYLLGRSVDKALDSLTGKELSTTSNELANFPKRVVNKEGNNEHVEIHKKIHEDPLFAMRQREIAAKKQLLNNPLKVKELKKMVEMEAKKKEKMERLQRNMDRRRRKDDRVNYLLIKELGKLQDKIDVKSLLHKLSDSGSNTDEDTGDEKLKSNKNVSRKKRKTSSKTNETDSESDSENEDNSRNNLKSRKRVIRNKRSKRRKASSSSSSSDEPHKSSKYNKQSSNKRKKVEYDSSSSSESESESSTDIVYKNRKKHSSHHTESKKLKPRKRKSEESSKMSTKRKKPSSHSIKRKKHKSSESSRESSDTSGKASTKRNEASSRKSKASKHISSESSEESSSDTSGKASTKRKNNRKKNSKRSSKQESFHYNRRNSNSEKDDDRLLYAHSCKKPFGLSMLDGSRPDKTAKEVAVYKKEESKKVSVEQQKPRALTEKEREYELEQMTKNAKWRKNEREADYAKHKRSKQKEDKLESYDESFIKNQMAILANSGSMADRVKSKMNTVQRSGTTMDKSFVRK